MITPRRPESSFHPRNRHQGRYDMVRLIKASPELSRWIITTPRGDQSIDFSKPEAVKALNGALLAAFYGVSEWILPEGYLCPAIPGRSDYVHQIADLLSSCNGGVIPRGDRVQALDIGVGASCIYPIIGRSEYGWRFVGSDIDAGAIESSERILRSNPQLAEGIELRRQTSPQSVLQGVVRPGELIDVVICNPPFHSSQAEAQAGSARKWRNLGRESTVHLNFGGQSSELWCPGGEVAFAERLIRDSVSFSKNIAWFSILISQEAHLPFIYGALKKSGVVEQRTIRMEQGQKNSRFVTWSFLNFAQQKTWFSNRFRDSK